MFVIFTLFRMDPVSSSGQDILSNVFGRFSESFQNFLESYRKTGHCVTQTCEMHKNLPVSLLHSYLITTSRTNIENLENECA